MALQALAGRTEEAWSSIHIFDLPLGLLGSILARIHDPVTAAHVLCTCRLFRRICTSVPFCFRISDMKQFTEVTSEEVPHNKYSIGARTRRLLASIRSQMPMTKSLDLSGCWILDEDVAAVLADLRCLKCLILDGCQKLTSVVADALAVSVRSRPQALSVQRCFGIGPSAAGNLIAAAAAEGSQLLCVLLSHLDRLDLPRGSPLLETQEWEFSEATKSANLFLGAVHCIGSGIRILALHNCGNLGPHELAAVGATCPMLEFLMLGGSFEGRCSDAKAESSTFSIAATVSSLIEALEIFKHLRVLETTFFPESIVEGIREKLGSCIEVWNFCEKESVHVALLFLEAKVNNIGTVMHTGKTFMKQNFGGVNHGGEYIYLALRAAVNCSDIRRRTPLHIAAIDGDVMMTQSLLSMGASPIYKDSSGATALFNAAWYGHTEVCHLLLRGGADVLSRNRSCENPLYIAALRGYTHVVEVMLSHCQVHNINWQSADIYGDGWTPLMAAAVADRQDVAVVLLQAAGVYMCINCSIEGCAICSKDNGNSERVNGVDKTQVSRFSQREKYSEILDAQNRYGQTALHIAARRASVWFVSNLLHAGASVNIRDEFQKRPIDIAQNQKHALVTNILKQWGEQLKKMKTLGDGSSEYLTVHKQLNDNLNSFAIDKAMPKSVFTNSSLRKVWKAKDKRSTTGQS